MKVTSPLPGPVLMAFRKLGEDIKKARLHRRIPTALMAERAFISRGTLNRIEKGDAGVSMGNYAAVLFVLGLTDRLKMLAEPAEDYVGLMLEEKHLPKRIHTAKRYE